jgi:hypothetical protein
MIATAPAPSLDAYPLELIDRVVELAAEQADFAAGFLRRFGLLPPAGGFSAEFLLELGAVGRMFFWEYDGLDHHRDAGLPSAGDALLGLVTWHRRPDRDPSADPPPSLMHAVFVLSVEHLAWTGPRDLKAEVLLGFPDEDALVDAIARFLWENRRHWPDDEQEVMS